MMFDRKLFAVVLLSASCLSINSAVWADSMPGAAPALRVPSMPSNWRTTAPNFNSQRSAYAREPQAMLPPPDPINRAVGSVSVQAGSAVDMGDPLRTSDQYVDSPQTDAYGVRHFSNGRHFDLSTVPIQDAVAQTNSSTLGQNNKQRLSAQDQQARDLRRQARLQARQNGNNGFNNGFNNNGFGNNGFNNNRFGNNGYNNNGFGNNGFGNNGFGNNGYNNNGYNNGYRNGGASQPRAPYVTDWRNQSTSGQNGQLFTPQQQAYDTDNMDRMQRRAMRRRAREMQIRNYNF